jgi:hypothetical protein
MPIKLGAGELGDGETELGVVEVGSLGLDASAKRKSAASELAALQTNPTHIAQDAATYSCLLTKDGRELIIQSLFGGFVKFNHHLISDPSMMLKLLLQPAPKFVYDTNHLKVYIRHLTIK